MRTSGYRSRVMAARCLVIGALGISAFVGLSHLALLPETRAYSPAHLVLGLGAALGLAVGILYGLDAAVYISAIFNPDVPAPTARSPTDIRRYCDCGSCRSRSTA